MGVKNNTDWSLKELEMHKSVTYVFGAWNVD